jgi:hypothetical protein
MIEFADRFERRLELLVIGERATHPGNAFGTQAELAGAAARIAHREHCEWVAFAALTLRAAFAVVADGTHQQRAAQDVGGDGQARDELVSRRHELFSSHSYT